MKFEPSKKLYTMEANETTTSVTIDNTALKQDRKHVPTDDRLETLLLSGSGEGVDFKPRPSCFYVHLLSQLEEFNSTTG